MRISCKLFAQFLNAALTVSVSAAVGGAIVDTYGSRKACLFGTIVMSTGLLLLSFSKEYWHVMLALGVIVGLGEGFVIISAIKVVSE